MANNRMYLVNPVTGQRVLVAKHFAAEWVAAEGVELHLDQEFLAEPTLNKYGPGSTAWLVEYESVGSSAPVRGIAMSAASPEGSLAVRLSDIVPAGSATGLTVERPEIHVVVGVRDKSDCCQSTYAYCVVAYPTKAAADDHMRRANEASVVAHALDPAAAQYGPGYNERYTAMVRAAVPDLFALDPNWQRGMDAATCYRVDSIGIFTS